MIVQMGEDPNMFRLIFSNWPNTQLWASYVEEAQTMITIK